MPAASPIPTRETNKNLKHVHSKTRTENTNQKSDTHKNGIAFFIGKEELKRNRAAKFSSPLQPPNTKNHIKNPFLIRQIGVIRGQIGTMIRQYHNK